MNKLTKAERNRKIAVTGALGALTVLFGVTRLGMIPWFSGASITILHVPVILGALLEGLWCGTGIGAIFGFTSLFLAATSASGGLDVFFTNPLISVLPRVLMGPIVFFMAFGLRKILPSLIADGITAFLATMAHSVMVLGALAIFGALPWTAVGAVLVSNSLLEAGAAVVICVAVISVRNAISAKGRKSKLSDEADE
ncbi:MAG: ECF transporter S component [Treponemataceae bacterium]|nr:ECF transporter S component [Treponemataceae bacterium]